MKQTNPSFSVKYIVTYMSANGMNAKMTKILLLENFILACQWGKSLARCWASGISIRADAPVRFTFRTQMSVQGSFHGNSIMTPHISTNAIMLRCILYPNQVKKKKCNWQREWERNFFNIQRMFWARVSHHPKEAWIRPTQIKQRIYRSRATVV